MSAPLRLATVQDVEEGLRALGRDAQMVQAVRDGDRLLTDVFEDVVPARAGVYVDVTAGVLREGVVPPLPELLGVNRRPVAA